MPPVDPSKLIRPTIMRITPYRPGKPIEEVERELGITDIVKLASNENPLGPSPLALEAMEQAIRETRLYPDNDCFYLTRDLAAHLGVKPEQIVVGRGSDEILTNVALAFINPGDEVILPDHVFSVYDCASNLMEAAIITVPLKNYTYDLEAMAARFSQRTKVVYIANPNNPTGTSVGRAAVERFLEALPDHAIAVLDEAYYEYVDDPDYPHSLGYIGGGKHVIVARTFSKIYALAGLRVGYGVSSPEIAAMLQRVREPFNVTNVAQAAARASLRDPGQVERSRKLNAEGKTYLYREFERLGLPYAPSQSNFILVDVKRDCVAVFRELLKRGVIVRTGDIFDLPTHVRVSIGTREQNERFIAALEQCLV
jgi:histidinol-phosphate aminotransferase